MTVNICKAPFFYIEIFADGEVHNCCPSYIKYSIGNIYKNSIEEIWNSKRAKTIRKQILANNYSCCRTELCANDSNPALKELEYVDTNIELKEEMPLPKFVKFCHDFECNVHCITCRKNVMCQSKEELERLNSEIEKYYLLILKGAETVCMNGIGDCLASRHGRIFLKKIAEVYPNIKFDLHTNGLLCNEKNLKELNILDRISVVEISLHATTKETYDKIVLGSDWNKVIKNIEWLAKLKKQGKIDDLLLFFVVDNINYKEMPDFVKLAEKYGAQAYFWTYRNWGVQNEKEARAMSIFDKRHRDYNDLVEVLHNDIFKSKNCHLNPILLEISQSSPIEKTLKTKFISFKWHNPKIKSKKSIKYKLLKSTYKRVKKLSDKLEKKLSKYQ